MLSVLRNSYQRNARLSTSYIIVRSVWSHHLHTRPCKKLLTQEKFDCGQLQHLKLQKCDFRTTQHLCIPPIVAFLLRPVLHIGAALMGRSIKKWWTRKSKEEKEKYRQWYKERRNVFLGKFLEIYVICIITVRFFISHDLLLLFLQGCIGLYGLILFTYYIIHFKTDPLTQRSRFIIFSKEQESDLGKKLRDLVSKCNRVQPKIALIYVMCNK